ncbi:hypothetical protein XCR1_1390006 [Xenorhabdus cabanillasii JM26]|uniref:Uncharacterized protein n=1 Tax=Xenorhabdus cabanillasii JM26 TaxID=1427517 RepID=W1INW8_9GAMM|nr:hypothetical protein XCR1_1390006 [Xenorhabdus cabanillasii JM26]
MVLTIRGSSYGTIFSFSEATPDPYRLGIVDDVLLKAQRAPVQINKNGKHVAVVISEQSSLRRPKAPP